MTTPRRGAPFRSSSSARSAAQGTSRATSSVHLSQRERELTTFAETLNTRAASLRGAERRSNPFFVCAARWIASRSLSSGAHSRDPLARNDGCTGIGSIWIEALARCRGNGSAPLWERVGERGHGLSIGRNPSPGSHLPMRSDLSHKGRGDAEQLDCFAEPVIGRRFAPTRWLAMTLKRPRYSHGLAQENVAATLPS